MFFISQKNVIQGGCITFILNVIYRAVSIISYGAVSHSAVANWIVTTSIVTNICALYVYIGNIRIYINKYIYIYIEVPGVLICAFSNLWTFMYGFLETLLHPHLLILIATLYLLGPFPFQIVSYDNAFSCNLSGELYW